MMKAYVFGEKKSVVTSSTIPKFILNKRHNMLSYHRVREAITVKILEFHMGSSYQYRSDIPSKHWEMQNQRDSFDYQGDITLLEPD